MASSRGSRRDLRIRATTESSGGAYRAFAKVYAAHWEDYARLMLDWHEELVGRFDLRAESVVDLACGTGYYAIGLAKMGVDVVGIDASEDMLAVARRRARRAKLAVGWSCQDMREAVSPSRVDLVTCWFDSINYLITEDCVRRTFARVAAMLRQGGAFLFDVNTIAGLERHSSSSSTIHVNTPSCFVVSEPDYDGDETLSNLVVHGFIRGRNGFTRFREIHSQRGYPLSDIAAWLEEAGFVGVETFRRTGSAPADESQSRVYLIGRAQ
jgi:SAM-dependent methyltransferase